MDTGLTYRFADRTLHDIAVQRMGPAGWRRYEAAVLGMQLAVDTGQRRLVGVAEGGLGPGPHRPAGPVAPDDDAPGRGLGDAGRPAPGMTWSEAEYAAYLEGERRRFAWTLREYGASSAREAQEAALTRYPYEPPDAPYRGLIFHDEAWHWAMLHIHGDQYWQSRPDLENPPPEYEALS